MVRLEARPGLRLEETMEAAGEVEDLVVEVAMDLVVGIGREVGRWGVEVQVGI